MDSGLALGAPRNDGSQRRMTEGRDSDLGEGFADAAGAPHFHGHRDRLRARFREAGAEALADYELLEHNPNGLTRDGFPFRRESDSPVVR